MTTTAMLLWLGITTVYGWIMFKRGEMKGARDLVEMQLESGVFKDKKKMYEKMASFYARQEDDEG